MFLFLSFATCFFGDLWITSSDTHQEVDNFNTKITSAYFENESE